MGKMRDNIARLGLTAVGAVGEVATDWARNTMFKANGNPRAKDDSEKQESSDSASESTPKSIEKANTNPKSLFWDPYAIVEQLGYKDRPTAVTYATLKAMTFKMPIVQAIVQTRINQMASFCTPQHDRYQLGFRLKLRDSAKEPTKQDKIWIQDMEQIFMRTGVTDNPRGRDDMEMFMRRIMWDSLVYDQMTFEVVPNRKGVPAEWYAVDAATMRLADSSSTFADEDDMEAVRTVQVYDSMVISEFNQEEMCFGIRNPRTDLRLFGYGMSELEMLITTITSLLYAWEYNQNFFSQGSAAKGILNFKGAIPDHQLQTFRRQWYQMIASVENAWRTPIVNSDELQWVNMQTSNRDMEFSAWFDFLIKVACSIYSMDPTEINFKYGNTGQSGAGLQEASNKEKITESKERGLRPLLRFAARNFNKYIVWPINEEFEFDFVGLDAQTRDDMAELNTKRVKTVMMVDELRAEDDLPPLPDGKGEVILDPTWIQFYQMKEGGGMPGEEGGEGGFPPGEGDEEGDGEEMDFEQMLSKYDDKPEDEGGDSGGEKESAFDKKKKEAVKKSEIREWTVRL